MIKKKQQKKNRPILWHGSIVHKGDKPVPDVDPDPTFAVEQIPGLLVLTNSEKHSHKSRKEN